MIPDYKNIFAGVFYPGSQPRQVTSILRDFRTLTKLSVTQLENYSGIKKQTIRNIESGSTMNPSFNTIAKLAEGAGLCLVVDISANMARRQKGEVNMTDSPFAIYGDVDNPIEGLSQLLNILRKEGKLNLTKMAELTQIDLKILTKMFNGHNVWLENTLDLLSYFDFSVSLESRNYHKIWDQIGKDPKMSPNKHNLSQKLTQSVDLSIAGNINNPKIKNPDGSHLLFPSHKPKIKMTPKP